MGLNPFVQMAFGCAPLNIRLAAFLSAVNPSINCGGSWYLNVTLEPPTDLRSYAATIAHRHQHHRRGTAWDAILHVMFPLPASRVPSRSCVRTCCLADVYVAVSTGHHHRLLRRTSLLLVLTTLTEVVYHRCRIVESFAAFVRPRISSFSMATTFAWIQRGINTAASYIDGFPIGISDVEVKERGGALPWCLRTAKAQFAKEFNIPRDILSVTCVGMIETKTRLEVFLHSVWLFVTVAGWWKGDPFIPHFISLIFQTDAFAGYSIYMLLSLISALHFHILVWIL